MQVRRVVGWPLALISGLIGSTTIVSHAFGAPSAKSQTVTSTRTGFVQDPYVGGDPACQGIDNSPMGIVGERDLYLQHKRDICLQANAFGISPLLLAITIQHEGAGRSAWSASEIGKQAEYQAWVWGTNETVGDGQMRPDTAQSVSALYDGTAPELGLDEAAKRLISDSGWAIRMSAAYLHYLKDTFGLDDRQAFITYAFGSTYIDDLRDSNFDGPNSHPRGTRYDELYAQLSQVPGYKPASLSMSSGTRNGGFTLT